MTPQERQMIESLLNRVASTNLGPKDNEADALIQQQLGRNPNALYILTQTVLIQEMALNQANNRLHELQSQQQRSQPTSFLGRLFGNNPQPQQPPPLPPQNYAPPYDAPQGYPPPPGYGQPGGGGSSFLRSAAATATGVAAGALAFQGIESLFHHGGGGFGGGGSFLSDGPSETIINNYYDEPRGGNEGRGFESAGYSDDNVSNDSNDISDASYDDSNDYSNDDNSSTDV